MTNYPTIAEIRNALAQSHCGGHPRVSCAIYQRHVASLLYALESLADYDEIDRLLSAAVTARNIPDLKEEARS